MAQKYNASLNLKVKIRLFLALVIIVTIAGAILDYPQMFNQSIDLINNKLGLKIPQFFNWPFRLGLDLQGGTQLIYQADVSKVPGSDRNDSLEGVRDVIERRVNAFGVSEPLVQTTKEGDNYRVIVELAGVKDVTEAIKMIGETPLLEFKEQSTEPAQLTEEQKKEMEEYNKKAKASANEILTEVLAAPDKFSKIAKEKSEDLATNEQGGDLGFIQDGGTNGEFFKTLKNLSQNEVYGDIIENSEGYNILKRGEMKEETKVKASHLLICYKGAERCDKDTSKEDARKKIEELKSQATAENFAELVKANSTEPGASESAGDLGYFSRGQMVKEFEDAVFSMETGSISDVIETQFGFHLIYKSDQKQEPTYQAFRILIKNKKESDYISQGEYKYTGLTGKHLKKAQVNFDPNTNEPQVSLEFNDEGKDLFADITGRNVGKIVGIFLDGEAISLPKVNEKISEGKAVITGKFTLDEAKTLTRRLNAGALPVPIELVSQQTVGASLGQQFADRSLKAGLLAFILIAIFMICYYRLPGLLSVFALVIYSVVIMAIFKLIPVTLTLSGIAGFVLSVGMAVDANVLIFERMKEELGWGKPLGSASEEGFRRAWPSIRDSNVTTLISSFILYWFGTSIIKGFALTLSIGVLISMVSAILITKNFMTAAINLRFISQFAWLFPKKTFKNKI
ncbi:MAG: protein-export membrane protein SecD [Candidatus Buchananbacteria bacterium RBG_13_39_9]|uniref:Protein translocase subunit SecD n=1 Tax=Candidatus Buchananbacteria bacterium RBG_13_39_9 TaxID=1797531 RepID=A0A1G1XRF7_9BACT|nr:MAG: protein-export membrane protein SecD [Candidatus Buchananbacteria bacterium RBG_13_39_9]